ncbi:MAG: DinB family protein [Pseudomonadota bacterium]
MVSIEYVRMMAQYNAWQNNGLIELLAAMDEAELTRDRAAFFGSILGTLNHLLWGDRIWMSRFAGWPAPAGGIPESTALTPTYAAWKAERQRTDGKMLVWAEGLRPIELRGGLTWYSGALEREVSKPKALLVMHMFNHQTHHRGQVHAMLTAAGLAPQPTDLFALPMAEMS